DEPAYLRLEFVQAFELRAIAVSSGPLPPAPGAAAASGPNRVALEASDDGVQFRKIVELSLVDNQPDAPAIASFAPVRAQVFRLAFTQPRRLAGLELSSAGRIAAWTR